MSTKTIIQTLTFFIILLVYAPAYAQQTATALMNVTVEVVDGSSIEMNQNEIITFNKSDHSDVIFAVFTISHDQENSILTSASQTIQMMNGIHLVEMTSILHEHHIENGRITLEFSTGGMNHFTDGYYTGKQIAEVIYL